MPQISKILNSRDEWKNKAIERAAELRELRKSQQRHLEKIANLKRQNCQLERLVEEKKTIFQ
jgi:hypothetical protein